jgi:hypothetical protein
MVNPHSLIKANKTDLKKISWSSKASLKGLMARHPGMIETLTQIKVFQDT